MCQLQDKLLDNQLDWNGVRPIYKKLSDEFQVLLSAFDIVIDKNTKLYLDHLICCIDRVDDKLDSLIDKQERQNLSKSMISLIKGDIDKLPIEFLYPGLETSLLNLRSIAEILNTKSIIMEAAHTIFTKTEDKRHELNIDVFIAMVQDEGEATAALPLSIIGKQSNDNFIQFFTKLCRLMGIADLVADASGDYKSNLISFKPTIKIYLKLLGITVSEGIKLLLMIPHKFRFVQYCFRFITILWK